MSKEIRGHVDVEVIDDLVEDINSWGTFYIVGEESLEHDTEKFLEDLQLNDVDYVRLFDGSQEEFKGNVCEDDVLLAICEAGEDEFILDMARIAKSGNVRVYAICGDSKSSLALLADEILVNEEYFSIVLPVFFIVIINKINGDFREPEEEEIDEPWLSIESLDEKPQGNVFPQFSGAILQINVKVGDRVSVGDKLYVIEHMKMETEIFSEIEGIVKDIYVESGDIVFPDEDCIMNIVDESQVDEIADSINPSRDTNALKNVFTGFDGMVRKICVKVGDKVSVGDRLCVVEAMKMENDVCSDVEGVVREIHINPGDIISRSDCIMDIGYAVDSNDVASIDDDEFIDDFVEDATSWGTVYIVCDEDLHEYAMDFQRNLESNGIDAIKGTVDGIKEWDVLLAISISCGNEVTDSVKLAKFRNVKVYGISNDIESDFALLCDEMLVIGEDFDVKAPSILSKLADMIANDFQEKEEGIMEAGFTEIDDTPEIRLGNVFSPLQGLLTEIHVNVGDKVNVGDEICVIEAMKMENRVCSEVEGVVKEIHVQPGDPLQSGECLMNIVSVSSSEDVELLRYFDLIDDFVDNLNSWGTVYIVCDEGSKESASDFQDDLESCYAYGVMVSEEMEEEFKDNAGEDDVLLAISEEGSDNFIREIVKSARVNNTKVYAICSNFRSGLALLSDETFIIEDDFKNISTLILKRIIDAMNADFQDKEDDIMKGHSAAPVDSRAPGNVLSPSFGTVIGICVNEGDKVNVGDRLCVIEVFKMESEVLSEVEGIVRFVFVEPGEGVTPESPLMNIK
jgi:biotin carboxyl carrier protein